MTAPPLDAAGLRRALALRDLTDPALGPHAMQLLVGQLTTAVCEALGCTLRVVRASPIVTVEDNYDRLRYPPGGPAREARYTRYLEDGRLLRTQTSALVPPALRALAPAPDGPVLLACPGLVYRRDCIDRLHTGEPHQLDLWVLDPHRAQDGDALTRLSATVLAAALPGASWRSSPAVHPYTLDGRQLDVLAEGEWIEVGECGVAHPEVLRDSGLAAQVSALAMGLGLDRLLMLRKNIPDIRLLRSGEPRCAAQLLDLAPWRPVSSQPAARRDLFARGRARRHRRGPRRPGAGRARRPGRLRRDAADSL